MMEYHGLVEALKDSKPDDIAAALIAALTESEMEIVVDYLQDAGYGVTDATVYDEEHNAAEHP